MKTTSVIASLLFMAVTYFSCKPKGPKDLILGTWQLSHSPRKEVSDSVKTQLTFTSDGAAKFESYTNGTLSESDSATYRFSQDGQYLVTFKNGAQLDSVKIAELTDKVLKIKSVSTSDTTTIIMVKK